MAVSTRFPTTNAAYSGAGLTDPNNAHADDGVYATCDPAKNGALGTSYGTFGFDSIIPAGATITKVQIIYQYKTSTTASIATSRTKARISSVDEENHDNATEPAADTTITTDITADRAWVRNDLIDGTLEVVLEGRRGNSNTGVTFSYDFVQVEATYAASYTITAALGSLSETGQIASLLFGRKVTSAQGAFSEFGQLAGLYRGFPLTAAQGSFAETGQSANLLFKRLASAAFGSFVETGQTAGLLFARILSIAQGAFAETGNATTLSRGFPITAAFGAFAETGQVADLRQGRRISMVQGSFAETGSAANLLFKRLIAAVQSAFALTGTASGLLHKYVVVVVNGSFALSGHAATLLYIVLVQKEFPFSFKIVRQKSFDVEIERIESMSPFVYRTVARDSSINKLYDLSEEIVRTKAFVSSAKP